MIISEKIFNEHVKWLNQSLFVLFCRSLIGNCWASAMELNGSQHVNTTVQRIAYPAWIQWSFSKKSPLKFRSRETSGSRLL